MEKKSFKLHILIFPLTLLVLLPVYFTAEWPGLILFPAAFAVLACSLLSVFDFPAVLIGTAVLMGVTLLTEKGPLPLLAGAFVLAAAGVTAVCTARKADFFKRIAWYFLASAAIVALAAVGLALAGETDLLTVVQETAAHAFPDDVMDTIYRGLLLTEYASGASTASALEYMDRIMSLPVEEVRTLGGALLADLVRDNVGYGTMLTLSVMAVLNSLLGILIGGSSLTDRPALGLTRSPVRLPSAAEMSLPQPHGRILGVLYLIAAIAGFFGLNEALIATGALLPLFFTTGVTFVWFYLKNTARSRAMAVMFLVFALFLCGTWLMVTAGLIDAITNFRKRFAEFLNRKENEP
ncbi:MAG: hypothetical protein KIG36_03435 [Eubacteriales bacterium]|nr:hypothetical protein [Eubacteriales bacterium]